MKLRQVFEADDRLIDKVAQALADNIDRFDDDDIEDAISYEVEQFAQMLRDRLPHYITRD